VKLQDHVRHVVRGGIAIHLEELGDLSGDISDGQLTMTTIPDEHRAGIELMDHVALAIQDDRFFLDNASNQTVASLIGDRG
jgi:hypothetical protein